jgi:ATP-dependent protease HslVU (ClpYQ) ATPase subunit
LHTVLEKVLEEISFGALERPARRCASTRLT